MRKLMFLLTILMMMVIASCGSKNKTNKFDDLQKTISSERTTKDKKLLDLFFIKEDSALINTTIFYSDTIQYKGKNCFLFFTKTIPADKQYVSALLTSALDVQIYDVDSYELVYQKQFTQAGNFGGDPIYSILKFGPDNIGLVIEKGNTQMGITTGFIDIFKFIDNEFRQVLKLENAFFDNSGYVGNDTCALKTTKTSINITSESGDRLEIIKRIEKYDENLKRVIFSDTSEFFSFDKKMDWYKK